LEALPERNKDLFSENFSLPFAIPDASSQGEFGAVGGRVLGRTFVRDAANLEGIADGSYKMVLASHALEHLPSALQGLKEWDRVLDPCGYMILILPWAPMTHDRSRSVHNMLHHVHDFAQPTNQRLLYSHYDEMVDTVDKWKRLPDSRKRNRWQDAQHWHVFDLLSLRQLLQCLNYEVLVLDLLFPYHLLAIGRKPALALVEQGETASCSS
jgi:SAM-dependent methyltransferase